MGSLLDELAKHVGISTQEAEWQKAQAKGSEQNTAAEKAAAEHAASAPRYPNAQIVSQAETQQILTSVPSLPANPDVQGEFDPSLFLTPSTQIVRGDLTVDELLMAAEGSHLIILGNLVVNGILKQEFRSGHLLVMGNLTAEHIVTTSGLACIGDFTVRGTLYGSCTNYSTDVW